MSQLPCLFSTLQLTPMKVVANMEPLHEFNPCQDLSPPLKQEGFAPLGTDELPSKQKHQKKTRAYDYDKRLRNAVKLVRRAALVGAERAEGEVLDRAVNVGGRSLTWAVSESCLHHLVLAY